MYHTYTYIYKSYGVHVGSTHSHFLGQQLAHASNNGSHSGTVGSSRQGDKETALGTVKLVCTCMYVCMYVYKHTHTHRTAALSAPFGQSDEETALGTVILVCICMCVCWYVCVCMYVYLQIARQSNTLTTLRWVCHGHGHGVFTLATCPKVT